MSNGVSSVTAGAGAAPAGAAPPAGAAGGGRAGAADGAQEQRIDAFDHQRPPDHRERNQRQRRVEGDHQQRAVVHRQDVAEQHVQQVDIGALERHDGDAERQRDQIERRQRGILLQFGDARHQPGEDRHREAGDQPAEGHGEQVEPGQQEADGGAGQDGVRHGVADQAHPPQHQEHADRRAAERQKAIQDGLRLAEQAAFAGQESLTRAVAQGLFKLMAYKDEYEVARLHSDPAFLNSLSERFEGDYRLQYHLAPPLLAQRNDQGELQKRSYGAWMLTGFKVLARLKGLRGTPLDVFGYTEERRTERALIGQYRSGIESLLGDLNEQTRERALAVARWPEQIKGFGHVKERHLAQAQAQWRQLMQG